MRFPIVALALGCIAMTSSAATYTVPTDFATIQGAIDSSWHGDTIVVLPGTYPEHLDFLGRDLTVKSQAGPEVTILDGTQTGAVVSFVTFESPLAVLEGFTITNGTGVKHATADSYSGGGIYCKDASPTIRGNVITGNAVSSPSTWGGGGGVYCTGGAPTITGNLISNNLAWAGESASGSGGGVHAHQSNAVITRNVFRENTAIGGVTGGGRGGGVYFAYAPAGLAVVANNLFVGNSAGELGGGLAIRENSGPVLVTNNTFHENVAGERGGAIHVFKSAMTVANTICRQDQAPLGSEVYLEWSGTVFDIRHSDVQGGMAGVYAESGTQVGWGPGMIDADPAFFAPEEGDYRLGVKSACVDAGDNAAAQIPAEDLGGEPRLFDGDGDGSAVVDIGADELRAHHVPATYGTIQSAIVAAAAGEFVAVAPGTYLENIDFLGRAIVVESTGGSAVTTIDGQQAGPVVTFAGGEGAESQLVDLTLTNGAGPQGGGVRLAAASPTLRSNRITGNTATIGGGLHCDGGAPTLRENVVSGNQATSGAGLAFVNGAAPVLEGNDVGGNTAAAAGGGLYVASASLTMTGGRLEGNHAATGGGVFFQGANAVVRNCVLRLNTADVGGGLSSDGASSVTLTNDVLYGNSATTVGGAIESAGAPVVTNSVLWNNLAPSGPQIAGAGVQVAHSDVQGGWLGVGNIDADPSFVDAPQGDFHLQFASPCIDAGDDGAPALPETDDEGDPRVAYVHVDMGADEYTLGGGVVMNVPADYPTIQAAIDTAGPGDVVRVGSGVYFERIDFLGQAITVESSGGAHATAIDGQQGGSVVTFASGEGPDSVLRGFTLRNGSGTWHEPLHTGGFYGGGVFCRGSSPTLEENVLSGNQAAQAGGGLYGTGGTIHLVRNVFSGNTAFYGGGVYVSNDATLDAVGNDFVGNHAVGTMGGGLLSSSAASVVEASRFIGNTAQSEGGGFAGRATLSNCAFVGNTAYRGGAMSCKSMKVVNGSFTGNTATYGGAAYVDGSALTVTNSIFWNDTASGVGQEFYLAFSGSSATLSIDYSLLQGLQSSIFKETNCWISYWDRIIDNDPRFVDPAGDDLHLRFDSPCLDAGNNAAADLPSTDYEGDPRIVFGLADMGADEFHRHLYHTGDVVPGGAIAVKITDVPGTTPVALFVGAGVLPSPLPSPWGDWQLDAPLLGPFFLGVMPVDGVITLPATLATLYPGPYVIAVQAIVGSDLTNVGVLAVPQ